MTPDHGDHPSQPEAYQPPADLAARFCVVLVRTQGPVNLGMILRLCGNTGITDLRLVNPLCELDCADARKFANHERHRLLGEIPVFDGLVSAVADCGLVIGTTSRSRDPDHGPPLPLPALGDLLELRPAARTAIVFGNEATGLTAEELHCCQEFLMLETPGYYHSYNLANAVAIILYHISTLGAPRALPRVPASERQHVERLTDYWLESLERFNYFRRTQRERWQPSFVEMLNRWHLTRHDVDVLFGIIAQFNYFAFEDKMAAPADLAEYANDAAPSED